MPKKNKEPEKTLQENLSDPLFVNFNLLSKIEEIKKINYAIYEVQKAQLEIFNFIVKAIQENSQLREKVEETKEEREGTLSKN